MLEYIQSIVRDSLPNAKTKIKTIRQLVTNSETEAIEIKLLNFTFYLTESNNHVNLVYGAGNNSPYTFPHKYTIPYNTTKDLELIIPYYLKITFQQIEDLLPTLPVLNQILAFLDKNRNFKLEIKKIFKPKYLEIKFSINDAPHRIQLSKTHITIKRLDLNLKTFKINANIKHITNYLNKLAK